MRMVVGLDAGARWEDVADTLRALGARDVRPPAPSLPDVLLGEFEDVPADELTARLTAQAGVRYAEPDVLQDGF